MFEMAFRTRKVYTGPRAPFLASEDFLFPGSVFPARFPSVGGRFSSTIASNHCLFVQRSGSERQDMLSAILEFASLPVSCI